MESLFQQAREWWGVALSLGGLAVAVVAGLLAHKILFWVFSRWTEKTPFGFDNLLVRHWRAPSRLASALIIVLLAEPVFRFPPQASSVFRQALGLALIVTVAWLAIKTVAVFRDLILSQYDITAKDNLRARAIYTQIRVAERVIVVLIGIVALSSMLMTFDRIRQVGVSILASAGIVGIIAGFAAQKSIATIFAGIQIAFAQPIRLDDVVIVENEWGRIEEITLTYVVVRIWDLRRLIVPITYFIEKPFQNWTRVSADILGTVFLYADYTVPVQEVREELRRILESSPAWDRKVSGLVVTNATDRTIEMRALMSAADSGSAWDLRCEVREKLIAFIRERYPQCLPLVRAELGPSSDPETNRGPRAAQDSQAAV